MNVFLVLCCSDEHDRGHGPDRLAQPRRRIFDQSPLKKLEDHYRREDPEGFSRSHPRHCDDVRPQPQHRDDSFDDFEDVWRGKRPRTSYSDEVRRQSPDSPSKSRGKLQPVANSLSICLQSSISDSEVSVYSEAPGEKFRDLISAIANFSGLSALPALVFGTSRVVRLPSEKAIDRQQSLTLSTSKVFGLMMDAWFNEFKRKDHSREGLRAQPFHSIFKSRENRPSLLLFRSADTLLPMEVASNPSLAYPWIVQPTRRFEIKECDLWHFETQVRTSLRVLNFADGSLQALQAPALPENDRKAIQEQLPMVVRTLVQVQTALLCQLIQLRRDRYLSLLRNVEPEMVQRLRHAPMGPVNELFPSDLLKEIHEFNRDHWHNSAILHVAGLASNQRVPTPAAKPQSSYAARNQKKTTDGSSKGHRFAVHPTNLSLVDAPTPSSSSPSPPSVVPPSSPVALGVPDNFKSELLRLEIMRSDQDSLPVGGRLRFFWLCWREIGASKRICRWFRKGYALPFVPGGFEAASAWLSQASPKFLIPNYSADPEKLTVLSEMLQDLLAKQAIVELPADEWAFFNRVFLVPKRTGGFRLILDVSKLNEYLRVASFSMDTVQVIRGAVEPGM